MAGRGWWLFAGVLCACERDKDDGPPTRADSGADADTDTDADSDTDSDTDTAPSVPCWEQDAGAAPFVGYGTTAGAPDDFAAGCSTSYAGDYAYLWTAPAEGVWVFDTAGSSFDTVLTVLDGCGGAVLGCDDDAAPPARTSRVELPLTAGQSVIVVIDGYNYDEGDFRIEISGELPEADCADGLDDDADGDTDCADDDCAADPACAEICDDGLDNDGDFLVDCGDTDCAGVGGCAPGCPDVLASAFPATVSGSTRGQLDEDSGSCDPLGLSAPDHSVGFVAPADGTYGFALASGGTDFDAILYVLDDCGGAELACADVVGSGGETVAVALAAGQRAVIVVDGWGGLSGSYDLWLFDPGGGEICDDGIDDDLDADIDCADADCAADPACVEVCGDGLDNDGDGAVDCEDAGCAADPACASVCPEDTATLGTSYGSTLGLNDDQRSGCTIGSGGPDWTFAFTAPADGDYVFSTEGSAFDTVLAVLAGCGGPEIDCNDDTIGTSSEVTVALTAGQEVIVVVDGYDTRAHGDFVLTIGQ